MSKHFIDQATAKEFIQRFRDNLDALTTSEFKGLLPFAETFEADAVRAILAQPGCVNFRSYFAMRPDNKLCVVFVGVDANDNDILNSTTGGTDVIVEWGSDCPPNCSTGKTLL